jgi:hypothetical protein
MMGAVSHEIGVRFARALAEKDVPELLAILHPEIDFRGLTPGDTWETTSADVLVQEFMFDNWFDADDRIDALEHVETGSVADRDRVAYRLRVTNPFGVFLVEQQAYFEVQDERISWLRIMCSGYRPMNSNWRERVTESNPHRARRGHGVGQRFGRLTVRSTRRRVGSRPAHTPR